MLLLGAAFFVGIFDLPAGVTFLTTVAVFGADIAFFIWATAFGGEGFFKAFWGGFCTPDEDFRVFPEGFRDGEGLEFFFNGSQVLPKSRARKDR